MTNAAKQIKSVTAETITDAYIAGLRDGAGAAGDPECVAICDRALDGDAAARSRVAGVARDVLAEVDDVRAEIAQWVARGWLVAASQAAAETAARIHDIADDVAATGCDWTHEHEADGEVVLDADGEPTYCEGVSTGGGCSYCDAANAELECLASQLHEVADAVEGDETSMVIDSLLSIAVQTEREYGDDSQVTAVRKMVVALRAEAA